MKRARLSLQAQLMLLAAGSALVAAIGASIAAWSVVEAINQARVDARLARAAEVVRDEYQNLAEDAEIIVGLYSERATLKTQLFTSDQPGIAEALSTATNLRAIHFLEVTDVNGIVLARVDLGEPPSSGQSVAHLASFQHAAAGRSVDGLELDDRSRLVLTVSRPVYFRNVFVGSVQGGFFLDQRFVERMKQTTGADITLFFGETPFASSMTMRRDARNLPAPFQELVGRGENSEWVVELQQGSQRVRYYPLRSPDQTVVGMYAVGLRTSLIEDLRVETLRYFLPLALGIIVLASLAAALVARHLTGPLQELVGEARRIGAGDLESPLKPAVGGDTAAPEEIRALTGAMEEMRVRLHQLNRSREEYLFAVAHELQTPLASLGASAETLADDDEMSQVDRRRTVARIRRSIARVQNLVNNLLDLGSLRSGTFRVRPRPTSLLGPVNDALASLEPILLEKHQAVVPHVDPDAHRVVADGRRVSQVLVNLLSNASKYSDDGAPIRLTALRENGHVRVGVTDRGPGIPVGERSTIFDRYYRSAAQGDAPGVGLGLAIVKAIVEAHGGEVGIEEPEGPGVTVWFTLPAATGERNDLV